jgi:hypothetical protein
MQTSQYIYIYMCVCVCVCVCVRPFSEPKRIFMWRETELAVPPFYLLARHWHRRSHADNHWPLSENTTNYRMLPLSSYQPSSIFSTSRT